MSVPFRDDQCPARSVGLSHMAEYPDYVCQDCGEQCLIEAVQLDEPNAIIAFAEMECILDHNAMITGRTGVNYAPVRTDNHTDWSRCIQCGVEVENRYEQIGPQGKPWAKGRFGSPRQQTLDESVWGFLAWHAGQVGP